ncbi:MAG TPA: carboxypeptidase regulatory-like domain-containing protein, partial [Terriglobales bacterium]|nr:carboxypeptidase regulatory-like domain-containing protein [Terriglobales bacterium]
MCWLRRAHFLVVFAFILALAPRGFGQATSGSILGRIADSTDAVVVDAEVVARNENTGLTQRSKTDNDGYVVRNLPPGTYTITVSKSGFKTVTQSEVLLVVDQKLRLDFVLAPGSTSETVTVTGEPPLLQTQTVETGDVIQSRQILDLPLNGRNFLQLARLTPGVIGGAGGNTSNLAVNGQREFANSIMIDGVETTSNRNNDNSLSPSVDAVEQFKVVTSAYSAEYGHAAGAVVSIQTKSGSNGYHGSAYEFFRPNNTAAQPYSFGLSEPPGALKHHNFGATIGGPIKKDKLFFFGSYEGFRLRDRFSELLDVPPAGQINYLPNGDVDLSG